MKMVLWVDDLRDPPSRSGEQYLIARSVNDAKWYIDLAYQELVKIDIIDLDHDAGAYAPDGGDYINVLNYLEQRAYENYHMNCAFRIHSFNPVGVTNMRAIINRNGWEEVK